MIALESRWFCVDSFGDVADLTFTQSNTGSNEHGITTKIPIRHVPHHDSIWRQEIQTLFEDQGSQNRISNRGEGRGHDQAGRAGENRDPDSADVPTFLLSDGKAVHQLEAPQETKLNCLFESYFDSIPAGSLEPATVKMMRMHSRHLMRHLGNRFSLRTLTQSILQSYISKRSKEPGIRGRKVQAATIKKELTTLRGLWKWAVIVLPGTDVVVTIRVVSQRHHWVEKSITLTIQRSLEI